MAAAAGILHHQMTAAAQAMTAKAATPQDSSTTGTSSSNGSSSTSDDSATISANDFLTLLVTEMQNQDPTEDTDPNEYIDQLVQVNSLEQLIDINQTLSAGLGATTDGATAAPTAQNANAATAPAGTGLAGSVQAALHKAGAAPALPGGADAGNTIAAPGALTQRTAGNLGVPGVNRAAQRVGHALDGRTRAAPATNRLSATH